MSGDIRLSTLKWAERFDSVMDFVVGTIKGNAGTLAVRAVTFAAGMIAMSVLAVNIWVLIVMFVTLGLGFAAGFFAALAVRVHVGLTRK